MVIQATAVPVITDGSVMDEPRDAAALMGELDAGNDRAVADLVTLLYPELPQTGISPSATRTAVSIPYRPPALVHEGLSSP